MAIVKKVLTKKHKSLSQKKNINHGTYVIPRLYFVFTSIYIFL